MEVVDENPRFSLLDGAGRVRPDNADRRSLISIEKAEEETHVTQSTGG